MSLAELLSAMPYAEHLGIEVTVAEDGYAEGHLSLADEHSSVPGRRVGHGGVAYSLADTVAGAAVISLHYAATPTVDMRMDYLAPVTDDLHAEAEVVRDGGSVSVADVTLTDAAGTRVAEARGVFKTGGGDDDSPWGDGPGELDTAFADEGE
ncbi:PaaI family thioesterase [Halobium salinum]|uniref:PaaI family thioesterase n=1 Tax=Halobium salinum TaxID=1364940 RepID=A0ABD5PCI8_9EURY|nr:PaaI family thioesterase [Halobium salinum]